MTPPGATGVDGIAVIGMAGRFPGAPDVATFWENLRHGVASIERFDEPAIAGGDAAGHPRFVGAEGTLDDIDRFDAGFFDMTPREADITDPQQRLALMCAWEAFESAGRDPYASGAGAGVFLSSSLSSYLVRNLLPNGEVLRLLGGFELLVRNDKDYAASSISHRLGLTGPSVAVGSACSSSLVAVHLACQSLLSTECDLALAGGVSIQVPQRQGYVHEEGGIYSPDGHCRAFDADAAGTVGGSGAGVVLLARLDDALDAGDRIRAVIRGSAVNNDGGRKPGYTAPSPDGQAAVIAEALAAAGVEPASIGFVQAHGTGTPLGDAVEVAALKQAFDERGAGECAIGSVKPAVGHLDAAAGVAGLIATVLALEHETIPPVPHLRRPNPALGLERSPFSVSAQARPWPRGPRPRRAGVSAFGIGGTNAHVVVEEAPVVPARAPLADEADELLVVSARDEAALREASYRLAGALEAKEAPPPRDVAWMLATGRAALGHRRAVVARSAAEAAGALVAGSGSWGWADGSRPSVALVFPGQGAEHADMALELRDANATFREELDRCGEALRERAGVDMLGALRRAHPDPTVAQPALAAVELALAGTLRRWGIEPDAVAGHSLGECVAAAVAGVFAETDALALVAARADLLATLPPGALLAVRLGEDALRPLLGEDVSIGAVNAPDQCVATGPAAAVEALDRRLRDRGVETKRLSHRQAFHSPAVEPICGTLAAAVGEMPRAPAQLPLASGLTGDWADPAAVADPGYWAAHARATVRFHDAAARLLALPHAVVLEAGPGGTLSALLHRHPGAGGAVVASCMPHPRTGARRGEPAALLEAVGGAWAAGARVDWRALYRDGREARRVELPSYPWQLERHWIDPPAAARHEAPRRHPLADGLDGRAFELQALDPVLGVDERPGLRATLDGLCAALAAAYVAPAAPLEPGRVHTVADVERRLGILPGYRRLLAQLLSMLEEDGAIRTQGGTFEVLDDARALPEPETAAARVRERHPDFAGLVDLLVHCAASYPTALSTRGAGLETLSADGSGDLLRRTLERTAEHTRHRHLVQLVAELVERSARERPLRVLEVGAGGGRLTWELAAATAGREVEYWVTDVGRAFADDLRAEAARRGLAHVRAEVLDITRPPARAGVEAGAFDVVVAIDVVHAVPDVSAALANLRARLRRGGTLALIETTARDRWLSMIWGLSEAWWQFDDGLRSGLPLLAPEAWTEALSRAGFASVAAVPRDADDAVLLLAEAPNRDPLHSLPPRDPDPARWGWAPSWRRVPHAAAPPVPSGAQCLVLSAGTLGDRVARALSDAGADVARAVTGDRFADAGRGRFTIDPRAPDDYCRLLDAVGAVPELIVHAWSASATRRGDELAPESLGAALATGLRSVLELGKALAARGNPPCRLLVVSAGGQDVLGSEQAHPDRAMLASAVYALRCEQPWLDTSLVDVDPAAARGGAAAARAAGRLVEELLSAADDAVIAHRGAHRWLPDVTRLPLAPAPPDPPALRPGATYLICGGLGGIGLTIAEHLGRLPARLVLCARSPFPPREEWERVAAVERADDDATAAALRRLLAVEAAGAELIVERADVTRRADMRRVVSAARRRFGRIAGVVHAAGVVDSGGMVQRRSWQDTEQAITAKVRGALVLDRVLAGDEPDWVVACSSIGTVLHALKFGEVGYLAGNSFLDAWAARRTAGGRRTLSIAWTDWREAGMWARAQERLAATYAERDGVAPALVGDLLQGLSNTEGVEVFRRLVAGDPPPHVIVSTQDLRAMLDRQAAFGARVQADLHASAVRAGPPRRKRIAAAPDAVLTDLEREIAGLWGDLLGVSGIGPDDSFFDLGGDSLLALRVLGRLRDSHSVDLTIARLFEAPTLRELAAEVGAGAIEEALL